MSTLNDQVVLANDGLFLQRVRQSIISAAINISSDGLSTGINLKRHSQVQSILSGPDGWKANFAARTTDFEVLPNHCPISVTYERASRSASTVLARMPVPRRQTS
jgi:hypothetical protein